MNASLFPAPDGDAQWVEGSRALLHRFLSEVANTRLKVRILSLFLNDSGLCLSSVALAHRLGEPLLETQKAAQTLCDDGALQYCPQFAYADLCSLSLPFLAPPVRLQLRLLRFALRHEPAWVWDHFLASETRTLPALEGDGLPSAPTLTEPEAPAPEPSQPVPGASGFFS